MKICFFCDLHLPFDKNALQYDVFEWAVKDILKSKPDCVVFAGDVTCDGSEKVYDFFVETMQNTGIPFLFIPGNSDLRCPESRENIYNKASECKNTIGETVVFAVNDSNNEITEEQLSILNEADGKSIVFMHHPLCEQKEKFLQWRKNHSDVALFYGHLHFFEAEGTTFCLPAADPDKSIGEPPCIVYYDTVTKNASKSHYPSDIPVDLPEYFGISCYKPGEQIDFAINNKLKYIELRPGCVKIPKEVLFAQIRAWRDACGENLSIHLPDVGYKDGKVFFDEGFDETVELIAYLKADRVTLHVPKVTVGEIDKNVAILDEICGATTEKLNSVEHYITIGIENMHMTFTEKAGPDRRFGYTPEECLLFMEKISRKTSHKTGINFDIGHARNNAPYSQKYQIATWLSMLGKHIVGYHLHQVTPGKGKFENHMPITDVYGNLICFASFFKCWETGRINKAPVVFEMRPDGAYKTTLKTFKSQNRKV